jgi:hypothetical protein
LKIPPYLKGKMEWVCELRVGLVAYITKGRRVRKDVVLALVVVVVVAVVVVVVHVHVQYTSYQL